MPTLEAQPAPVLPPLPAPCTCFSLTLRAFGCQCEAVGRMSATDPYVEHPGKVPPGGAA